MNKIEKLHESIRALFRSEGEKFCYTPGEIERLVCSLNYKRLYSVLCDTAEPVYVCCAGGGMHGFLLAIRNGRKPSPSRKIQTLGVRTETASLL